jgi:hypothetical protein
MTGYPVPSGLPAAPKNTAPQTWAAIDVAKDAHVVLVESPRGRRQFRVANTREELRALAAYLLALPQPVRVGFEPTGVYHRLLAYQLVTAGVDVVLIASLACARYREARYTSWDKNDPKDAAVLLELLKQGITMRYVDPLVAGWHDVQEVSKTYWHVTLARTRVQHSLLTHFLPLYWPEFGRFWRSSRSEVVVQFLLAYPTPASVTAVPFDAFVAAAGPLVGRKVNKQGWLADVYEVAGRSAALPVALDEPRGVDVPPAAAALPRPDRAAHADRAVGRRPPRHASRLPAPPEPARRRAGVRADDPRRGRRPARFAHHRQFLKFCGLDLAKSQSARRAAGSSSRSAATRGCAAPSGSPGAWRSGCARRASATSTSGTRPPTRRAPTGGGKPTRPSRPRWRG